MRWIVLTRSKMSKNVFDNLESANNAMHQPFKIPFPVLAWFGDIPGTIYETERSLLPCILLHTFSEPETK